MEEKDRCFIITPIGDENDPIRRHVDGIIAAAIEPALGAKYDLVVAHRISEPGSITKQVIKEIYESKLTIANLTNRNPNVMYELAFRHSLGKPVIMIAEKGTSLPSDIIMERTIFYQNDAQGVLDLIDSIREAESKIDFVKESSPIYDVLHEYNKEAQIIRISEDLVKIDMQSGDENTNILKYILQKLNNLEDIVQSTRASSQPAVNDGFPRRTMFMFRYKNIERPYQIEKLISKLNMVEKIDPDIEVDDVHIESNQRNINVYAILYDRIPIPDVIRFFLKVFSEFGFTGVTVMEQR